MTNDDRIAKLKKCIEEYAEVDRLLTEDEVRDLLDFISLCAIVQNLTDYNNLLYHIQEILEG